MSKGLKPDYIKPFQHLFEKKNFDKLPIHCEWDHEINLTVDVLASIPQMMPVEQEAINQFVEDELRAGKIRESKLPYASLCFFIAKKDGSLHLVQDYQIINAITVKDKTPLPHIDDLLDVLEDGKLFTKMDIIWGYNNIRIKEGHEWKATFLTLKGLFKPTIMYFGLCNLPGTFMHMMQTIFRDMIRQWKCAIYMDNLIFKGKTKEVLCRNTLEGLRILAKHDLYIKESKCYWEVKEVPVLGHIVGKGCLQMEATKVKTIWNGKCWKIRRMSRSSMGSATFTTDMYEDIQK